jgi:UPF0716 family protein affecting phage T7 exclusion
MAEIRVERVQKRGLGWLWALLLVLLVAAVAWYLWSTGHLGARSVGPAADSTRTGLNAGRAVVTALLDAVPVAPSHIV